MSEKKAIFISDVVRVASYPIMFVSRFWGLFPFTLEKKDSCTIMRWSRKVVCPARRTINCSNFDYTRYGERFRGRSDKSIRMKQSTGKYVTVVDISIVALVVFVGIFGTPFRVDSFLSYVSCINEVDATLVVSDARRARHVSMCRVFAVFVVTTVILAFDLSIWWTISSSSRDSNFLIGNYIAFYISYYILLLLECQYWHLIYCIKRRLKLLNSYLKIHNVHTDDVVKNVVNKHFSIFKNVHKQIPKQVIGNQKNLVGNGVLTNEYITRMIRVYLKLCDAADYVNQCCGLIVLIILVSCLLHLVVTPYFLILEIAGRNNLLFATLQSVWLITHSLRLIIIVEACYECTEEAGRTKTARLQSDVQRFRSEHEEAGKNIFDPIFTGGEVLLFQLELFATELNHRQIVYTACGLVKIDRTLITSSRKKNQFALSSSSIDTSLFAIIPVWGAEMLAIYLISATSIAMLYLYYYFKKKMNFWADKGVITQKSVFPFGNAKPVIFQKESTADSIKKLYEHLRSQSKPYGGYYFLTKPVFVPVDLELIRRILIVDFDYFTDRLFHSNESEPLSNNLVSYKGNQWKQLRSKLSPAFTPSKIKMLFPTIMKSTDKLICAINEELQISKVIDINAIVKKVSIDITASSSFGLQASTLNGDKSEFQKVSENFFDESLKDSVVRTFMLVWPDLLSTLKIKTISKAVSEFFINMVDEVLNFREQNNVIREDLMHLLLQIRNNVKIDDNKIGYVTNDNKSQSVSFTIEEIAAQCFIFFLAGYETTASLITFCLYELSLNQEMQCRAREELNIVLAKHNGDLSYDALLDLQYLDKIIRETLRVYPPIPTHLRVCHKDYKVPNSDVVIEKDTAVLISVLGIHHDPDYYKNPGVFNPNDSRMSAKSERLGSRLEMDLETASVPNLVYCNRSW
ncbi:hypothetical protein FQA39_LY18689 [Lamprigera yunnana]|nr:hypothetical protein FQA39_LY18689 [Lamprigera yunnana]